MKIGIIGLKYSGKTSLFSLLTGDEVNFEKNEVNHGVAKVPDTRIENLSEVYSPKKTTFASIELIDIPGLDPNNTNNRKFFEDVRKMDMLLAVVRDFESDFYPNPLKENNIERDISLIKDELILQDLTFVEKRLESLEKSLKKQKNQELNTEFETMNHFKEILEDGKFLSEGELSEKEREIESIYGFFTMKNVMYVVNTSEDNITKDYKHISFCIKTEKEILELEPDEREMFYEELGIKIPALYKIMREIYQNAGLISFFTVGKDEVRAWTIKINTNAKKAAGKIHSDLEKGFIRAEKINYEEFIPIKDMSKAKNENLVKLEGKEYIVQDGDILNIRFNV
ncbi:MAG: redox-regulated ATPase YchF [Candidatus Muiribacterium halophilum]|uniref:Redox-regulated ATPase YchF n=1 Tax=Muiribacterium halophilum TaxID=2053465 RepID=A0A2N5ZGF5_MUIH1|nr:MAG: redox-regulated ATPase YchF [Candidatus Muirbacterium halophilum]